MTIRAWYDVWCDAPEAADECPLWTEGGSTKREAAENARAHGWKFTKDGWVCPVCQGAVERILPPAVGPSSRFRP